eukprot:CAMPEP_0178685554 /NCGR_PEP_ID=MMETSP0699-20121125/3448_1 /TAXON_ID=265572 /ORGANISM="Extubocellulus spinifer, Strain CCMP396" /LENGTH=222 /DNA_ID=CAMNT_0020330321 /DNA_START=83 /DNA_END=751 /DNA_ORIENTATION=+
MSIFYKFAAAIVCLCLVSCVSAFSIQAAQRRPVRDSTSTVRTYPAKGLRDTGTRGENTRVSAAPDGALSDIVIPSVDEEDDPRVWVPQTDCLSFRPLCLCLSQGYYVNLLKFKGGGVLGCHRHPSPVHALTLKGSWGYKEHDWHAKEGTYVFEPPGETHTLIVDEDCDEMVAMFHVTGALIYVDPESGNVSGYDDVFTKLEMARKWYEECGLGRDYAEQFIR